MAQQVTLPEQWVAFVERKVREGGYADTGEVLAAALEEWAARDEGGEDWPKLTAEEERELRAGIAESEAEIERGEYFRFDPDGDPEAFVAEIRAGAMQERERRKAAALGK